MPHIRFNWVDVLFVTLLIRIGYIGFKNGFLPEFFRLLGLLAAFILSFNNYTLVSQFLSAHAKWTGAKPDVISFLFIFLLIVFIFKIFATVSANLLSKRESISGPDRLAGLVLGLGRGALLVGLIYVLFVNSPFKYLSTSTKDRSFSGQYISKVAPFVYKIGINFYPWHKNKTPLVKLLNV